MKKGIYGSKRADFAFYIIIQALRKNDKYSDN